MTKGDKHYPAYINDMFARADLAQIRNFLQIGAEKSKAEPKSYHDRLIESSKPIMQRLDDMYLPDKNERDKAESELSTALSTSEDVYMELGMKIGARLIYQLLLTNDLPIAENTEQETE